MEIIEETTALGVPFCHFRTELKRNQYNLTFTKTEEENVYEVHLIPLVIHYEKGKIVYDKTMRDFICRKVLDFMSNHKCNIYFNINCTIQVLQLVTEVSWVMYHKLKKL